MTDYWIIFYSVYGLIGIFSGVMGGLLGISGGVITVPLLVFMFKYIGIPQDYQMHLAIGTSLGAMVFNALSATYAHHLHGGVLWYIVRLMLLGLLLGSVLGAVIVRVLSSGVLQKIFGSFECLLALYFFLPSKEKEIVQGHKLSSHGKWILKAIALLVGMVSNILGIGGGIFTVPTLMAFDVPVKKAIGTSVAVGLIISFMGALSYLALGLTKQSLPDSVGFLYVPAFIAISITTALAAPFGTKLAHRLSTVHLRRIFAFALITFGLIMLFG